MDRAQLKNLFIQQNSLHQAEIFSLPADASFRSYSRITHLQRNYILMDVPPVHEKIDQFMTIANFLLEKNLSAPMIIAADAENGFLLLEDFGDHLFSKIMADLPEALAHLSELHIYEQAIDVLIELQIQPIPDFLPHYTEDVLIAEAKLFTQWYLPNLIGCEVGRSLVEEFELIWQNLLPLVMQINPVIVHRDYHADNLIWLDGRVGKKQVGILDFQDAVIGSPVYDLVSLLEDARRDVSSIISQASINYYLSRTPGITRKDFLASYAILAAQRNCKIAGVFARKAIRDHNKSYLKFLPRVLNYLKHDLKHPLLTPLKEWMHKAYQSTLLHDITLKEEIA